MAAIMDNVLVVLLVNDSSCNGFGGLMMIFI